MKFCVDIWNVYVRFYMDNLVVVIYILKMGGKIVFFNDWMVFIWKFCMDRNFWLFVNYIVGVENIEVDFLFCYKNDDFEWMLDRNIFVKVECLFGKCDIDLFVLKYNF